MKQNYRGFLGHGMAILLFLALSLFVLALTALEVQRHKKYQEFESERLGEELLRSIRDGLVSETSDLPASVLGIGIYSPGGFPFILIGVTPSSLDPQVFIPGSGSFWVDGTEDSYFLVKPLIPPPPRGTSGDSNPLLPEDRSTGYLVVHIQDTQGRFYALTLWSIYGLIQFVFLVLAFLVWRLQNRNQQLLESLRAREETNFLGDVGSVLAHEIKTPLSTILLQARTVALTPENQEEGTIIAEQALRITELVERVRDLVRDPRGNPQRINLVEILQNEAYSGLLGPVPTLSAYIYMDNLRLRSCLENLIQNARESQNGEGPEINLTLSILDSHVRLEILDQGSGVSRDQKNRIFTPFHTTKPSGTGLGLALVRRFMEEAGGTVELLDRPEKGTCARLTWPEAK